MKKFKTPLRYPGGKSRATKILLDYIPRKFDYYVEPFIGGGSMAIALTKQRPDLKVVINDLYYPVFAFWTALRDAGPQMQSHLHNIKTYLMDHDDKEDVLRHIKKHSIKQKKNYQKTRTYMRQQLIFTLLTSVASLVLARTLLFLLRQVNLTFHLMA